MENSFIPGTKAFGSLWISDPNPLPECFAISGREPLCQTEQMRDLEARLAEFVLRYFKDPLLPGADSEREYCLHHTLRVVKIGRRIAEDEGADSQVIISAAFLHDTQKFVDDSKHAILGADFAVHVLRGLGASEALVERAASAIRSHYPSDAEGRRSNFLEYPLENRVLYDADFLDSNFGAEALRRFVEFYAKNFDIAPGDEEKVVKRFLERDLNRDSTWLERREGEKSLLKTATGRAFAALCLKQMRFFIERLEDELGDPEKKYESGSVHNFIARVVAERRQD